MEILEMHHRNKVDAPSGTALLLGQAAAEGRGIDLARCSERGRDGVTGARGHGKIGFASLRGGTVAGDHDVIFAGPEEMITLAHRAENRMIFARGAVKRPEERTSELQSLMRISYAVFCLNKKNKTIHTIRPTT